MLPGNRLTSSTETSFFTGSFELEDEAKTLGNYVVGQRLGEGAYGSVYVVKYIPSGDRFALKILQKQDLFTGSGLYSPVTNYSNTNSSEENTATRQQHTSESGLLSDAVNPIQTPPAAAAIVRTFEKNIISEAKVMQSLEHPHVVKFYKFLNSTTAFYFVLELAEGGELFDLILSKNYFTEDEARMYFQQLISAIDYCHRNGVAHKDLKAENLLLSSDGRLLVCDFGFSTKVAKENIDDPEETVGTGDNTALLDSIHNGAMFGTLHYTSPEAVLASAQPRDFDHLSGDDGNGNGNGSVRCGSALADHGFAHGMSGYQSQADMASSFGAGRPCSSSTPVSTSSSSDSLVSSRSGSLAQRHRQPHRARKHVATSLAGSGGGLPLGFQSNRETPLCQQSCLASALRGLRRSPSGCVDDDAVLVKTALEVASSTAVSKVREGRARPTPLTPPCTTGDVTGSHGTMHQSGSTQSLGSLASAGSKYHKKTSPTLGRNKVGEGISSFVKALLGTGSSNGSGHHHHHQPRQPPQQHTDSNNQVGSPRDKSGLTKTPITVFSTTANGKATLSASRGPTGVLGEGGNKAPEAKNVTGNAPNPGQHVAAPQELMSVLSSAVSSSTQSPTTASYHTNPSFADSAGRTGTATSIAMTTRRGDLSQLSGSPLTRLTSPAMDVNSTPACRFAAAPKEVSGVVLTAKSSTEELSGQTPSSHETGAGHQSLSLPTELHTLSGPETARLGNGSPFLGSAAPRKPPLVIVDPFQQDLWSAGVILFFMLTGRLPFDGRDEEETLHLIQTNEFAFDEDEVSRISPAARQLVTQMLAAEPTDRPTTEQIIRNPWFQVGLQVSKDFPHREDLQKAFASPVDKLAAQKPLTQQQVAAAEAVGSPTAFAASPTGRDGEGKAVHGMAKAAKGGGSSGKCRGGASASAAGAATVSLAHQNHLSTPCEGPSITQVALSGFADAAPHSSSCCSGMSNASGLCCDKSAPSTFLDFSTQHPVSAEEERVLLTAFRKVDSDGFGCITRDQLRDMLTTLHGDAVPAGDVDELVKLFTGDATADHITFKQFRDAWVSKDLAHVPFTHSSEFQLANIIGTEMDAVERQVVRQLRVAFDSLDENHRGVIQLDQVRRIFEKCHIPVQHEDCLSLIKYFHKTEAARNGVSASMNWHRWRVTPAATPATKDYSDYVSGSAWTPPPAATASLTSATAATPGCSPFTTSERRVAQRQQRNAADGAATMAWEADPSDTAVPRATSAGELVDKSLLAPLYSSPPPDSAMSPSDITISFDSFVSGIVKRDILLKHPLGRKLAAATNLAAMFQSRNVTECVRHGFLVTGLQNVILAKLAGMPERLLLLYSDEVVSHTENIYSFRYLGSSALVAGATMSSAAPLLMSASLVTMAASTGPASATSLGNSAQLRPAVYGGLSASHRSATASPQSSVHWCGRPIDVLGSFHQSHTGAGLVATPSMVNDVLGGGGVCGARVLESGIGSNAGSLPHNPAPTVTDVNLVLFRSHKSDLYKPSLSTTPRRSDSLSSPALPQDKRTQETLVSSGASRHPPPPLQQRGAAVPIPRPPGHPGTAATQSLPVAGRRTLSTSQSLALSHSVRHSPSFHGERSATAGGCDRHHHSTDNDNDSAHDDTHSFFSVSRHSSSIVNTSEDTQSASDGALSSLQEEEGGESAPGAVPRRRCRSASDTVALSAEKAANADNNPTQATQAAAVRGSHTYAEYNKGPLHKLSSTLKSQSFLSDAAPRPFSAVVTESSACPPTVTAASPRASSLLPVFEHNTVASGTAHHGGGTAVACCSPASRFLPQPSPVARSSRLHSPSSVTHINSGYSVVTPSTNFTHRAMAFGGTGAVAQVNGVCDVDVILSPACLGYTMVRFRRIHGKTSDFHEAVSFISNLLEGEREQAMEDTLTRGESELM